MSLMPRQHYLRIVVTWRIVLAALDTFVAKLMLPRFPPDCVQVILSEADVNDAALKGVLSFSIMSEVPGFHASVVSLNKV
jgi:hypothetical protein